MTDHGCEHYVKYVPVFVPAGDEEGGEVVFFFFPSYQAFMSPCGMFMESRPVSLLLLESPRILLFAFRG